MNETRPSNEDATASGTRLGKDRILERDPFRAYTPAQQEKVLRSGRVVNVGVGETLQFAGDKDACVHYLLSGAVVLESKQGSRTVAATPHVASGPLDMAGTKTHTIVASSDAEIFRVPYDALPESDTAVPIPVAAYAETQSGRELAYLVEQINSETDALRDAGSPTSKEPFGIDTQTSSLNELSASVESLFADLDTPDDVDRVGSGGESALPEEDDEVGRFFADIERRFRHLVDKMRTEERLRYESQLQRHAEHLQHIAQREVRAKLAQLNERYKTAYAEKDRRLRGYYAKLGGLANKVARQKAAIYAARRQIADKLASVEKIQQELSTLGTQLNRQLNELDETSPTNPPS